ncbi:MAG: redoxin domain-containing protein [Planctomycetales bacterium]|nr:redoxin domain-containing protein [Planctomycetales bacterium]
MRSYALLCGLCVMGLFAGQVLAVDGLKVGDAAPAFKMQGSDGKTYDAKELLGKQALIVAWFPRAFTGGCTKECKSMREAGEKLRTFDVAYFTASTDDVAKNADFAKSLELDYPILCDPTGENAKLFGVLKPDGKAANRVTFVIGADGKILSILDKVQTETHGEDLAKLLSEMHVAKKSN